METFSFYNEDLEIKLGNFFKLSTVYVSVRFHIPYYSVQCNSKKKKKAIEWNMDPRDRAKIQAAINSFQSSSLQ